MTAPCGIARAGIVVFVVAIGAFGCAALAACAKSQVTSSPPRSPSSLPSPSPSPSPSVSTDPTARTHIFCTGAFALAFGPDWRAKVFQPDDWDGKYLRPGGPAAWSLLVVDRSVPWLPSLRVTIQRLRPSEDPLDYVQTAARRLNRRPEIRALGSSGSPGSLHHAFEPATGGNGMPALMAAYSERRSGRCVEHEVYMIPVYDRVYRVVLSCRAGEWGVSGPVMRGIVHSFMLPGG